MAAKKKATKKKAPAAKVARPSTKSESIAFLAEKTNLIKKDIHGLFDGLAAIIKRDLKKHGMYTVPGLMKIKVVKKPATKARKGINPFTGEPTTFKAKPARKVVKIQALKGLKDLV
jgi:nucleoid DNA-binding protein